MFQEYAKRYLKAGLVPMPCAQPGWTFEGKTMTGKEPMSGVDWVDPKVDEAQIDAWCAQGEYYCNANIAILLKPSKLVVVDVLEENLSWVARLIPEDTPRVHTGRGVHFYFRMRSTDPKINAENVYPEQPERADGRGPVNVLASSYVMAPPSKHECGLRYRGTWNDRKFKPAPDWVQAILFAEDRRAQKAKEASRSIIHPGVKKHLANNRLQKRMDQAAPRPKPTGDPDMAERKEMVKSIISTAPIKKDHQLPMGWYMCPKYGVWAMKESKKEGEEPKRIYACRRPVLISQQYRDDDGDTFFKVVWHRKKRWHDAVVNAAIIANTSKIQSLATKYLPVNSDNAFNLVRYLSAYELANEDILKTSRLMHHLGWANKWSKGDGVFLWGEQSITSKGVLEQEDIIFKAKSPGEQQLQKGFHKAGTYKGWIEAYEITKQYPLVRFGVFAALAAPLLELCDAPNFVVDWSGVSSRGKSTSLEFAASVWGQPTTSGVIQSWRGSMTGNEKSAAALSHMPLFMDDTKQARDNGKLVAATIYEVVNGVSSARGTVGDGGIGLQRKSNWRTVMMSTGEKPAVEFSNDGGTRARCISIAGHPMGEKSAENAALAEKLQMLNRANYGHLGPRFVEYLIKHHWGAGLRVQLDELTEVFRQALVKAEQNPRKAKYFAVIAIAAEICSAATDGEVGMTVDELIEFCGTMVVEADQDRADLCLSAIAEYVARKPDEFWKGASTSGTFQGFTGIIRDPQSGGPSQAYVAFPTHSLHEWLEDHGYESSLKKIWKARGYLQLKGNGKGMTKQIQINNVQIPCVVFKWQALYPPAQKQAELKEVV